jgi:hypothetical protein
MWVEEKDLLSFNDGDPIAVVYDQNPEKVVGNFRYVENTDAGYYLHFTTLDGRELGASDQRRFYKQVEDKPEDSVNQLDVHVDQSALRLRKPDPMTARIENLERGYAALAEEMPQKYSARIGIHHYTLREGEHLRAWVEDGRLYTELVQENK